jgi:nucleoid-associated protein YgaU
MATGTLEKLTIVAFKDAKLTEVTGSFIAMFNPSTFSVNASNTFDDAKQPAKGKSDQKLKERQPRSLSFELFFDGTVASPTSNYKGPDFSKLSLSSTGKVIANDFLNSAPNEAVTKSIDAFMKTTFLMDDKIHRPPFLAIIWGTFLFSCVFESANVTYSLFQNDGKPLRAKISVSAKEHITEAKLNEILKLKSPDLTQSRTVLAGDTLPNLAKKTYGDEKLYLELARVNNIKNYRRLKPGTQLIFPPIEKIKAKA